MRGPESEHNGKSHTKVQKEFEASVLCGWSTDASNQTSQVHISITLPLVILGRTPHHSSFSGVEWGYGA